MAKTYAETLAYLEGVDGGSDYLEAIKTETSKIRVEAKNMRALKKNAESGLEKVQGDLSKIYTLIGYDSENDSDNFDDKLSAFQKTSTSKSGDGGNELPQEVKLELAKLQRENKATSEKLEASEKRRSQSELNAKKEKTINELKDVFKGQVILESAASKIIMSENVRFDDDGPTVYTLGDEEFTDAKEFSNRWVEDNPDWKKNTQAQGGGTNSNGGSNGSPNNNEPTMEQLAKMSPDEYKAATEKS